MMTTTERTSHSIALSLTDRSLELFEAYAKDADNWSGTPCVGGNVGGSKEDRGNLTHLKRAGLIETQKDDGQTWLYFTNDGKRFAREWFGVEL